jgi:hypothetical protein
MTNSLENLVNVIPDPTYFNPPNFLPVVMLNHANLETNELDARFSGTDSPSLFEQNLKIQPEDWHYRTKHIEYKINSSGYRTEEWSNIDWKESVVMLGCSNVLGIGLADDETISHQLSFLIDRPVINLGAPGVSFDFSFYNSIILSEYYPTPYAVVDLWTGTDRCTYFDKIDIKHCGIWEQHPYFKEYIRNDTHSMLRAKFVGMANKNLWKPRCRYYSASFFDRSAYYTDSDWIEIDNQARDLIHPGRNNSKDMARLIAKNIN